MNGRGTHIAVRPTTRSRKRVVIQTGRRSLLNSLVLVSGIVVFFSFVLVSGVPANQDAGSDSSKNPEIQSKLIKIYVDRPITTEFRRSSNGTAPPEQTEIQFTVTEPKPWTFVKFDELPKQTSIKVKDEPAGYQESEQLKSGTWYPFKTMLPVIFNIESNAQAPVQLKFSIGYPEPDDDRYAANLSTSQLQTLAQANLEPRTPVQVLGFYWGTSIIAVEPASLTFAPTETSRTVTLKGDPRLWTIVRIPEFPSGFQAIIKTDSADNLTSRETQLKAGEWIGFRASASLEFRLDHDQIKPNPNTATLQIETAIDQSTGQTRDDVNANIKAGRITSNGNIPLGISWNKTNSDFWLILGTVVALVILLGALIIGLWKRLPEKRTTAGARREEIKSYDLRKENKRRRYNRHEDGGGGEPTRPYNPAPVATLVPTVPPTVVQPIQPLAPTIKQEDLDRMKTELQNQITTLKSDLEAKLISVFQNQIKPEYVNDRLSNLQKDITSGFDTKLNGELQTILDEVARLEQEQKASKPDLTKLENRIDTNSTESLNRIGDVEKRLTGALDQLQKMVVEQAFPESYFARTMGMILSKNILELHEGNLERLLGEAVDNFFQTDVPRPESLQELRQRAESIIVTLKSVLEIVSSKKPEVEHEVRLRFGRAEALLARINDLQGQMQTRKLTIETTLRIPCSAYAGARQTLIEELGRGIRSELDKLANPQDYFEGDLERLVTADLIAIVDICDKKVSLSVGADSEVESVLQQLFQHAGLRPILPSSGDPFGTAEQDLIQMVPGVPGTSMTVAEVVTRGFYYMHRDNETLLRKAGVMIYR